MKNRRNKKISTIEDLAALVQQEFLAVQKEFLVVHKKLDNLRKEVLEIKADLENIKLRIGEMAFRFEIQGIEKRLKQLELKVGLK